MSGEALNEDALGKLPRYRGAQAGCFTIDRLGRIAPIAVGLALGKAKARGHRA
jgi:hypothetical protein